MFSANRLIDADASELDQLAFALANMEGRVSTKAIRKVTRQAAKVGADAVVETVQDDLSETGLSRRKIRQNVAVAYFNAGGNSVDAVLYSGWFRLADHGMGRKSGDGLQNKLGHYSGAFKATMDSGHRGIFKRIGKQRLPIREMWGLNPMREVERGNSNALEAGQSASARHLQDAAYQLLAMAA